MPRPLRPVDTPLVMLPPTLVWREGRREGLGLEGYRSLHETGSNFWVWVCPPPHLKNDKNEKNKMVKKKTKSKKIMTIISKINFFKKQRKTKKNKQ